MTYGNYFQDHSDDNLSWCKPYVTPDMQYAIAVNEGKIVGMRYDGSDVDPDQYDSLIYTLARTVNPDYDYYRDWEPLHIALDTMRECGCIDCPWFDLCEAMAEEIEDT